ncbi:MAG: hypothetical protein ACLRNQ_23895 [Flavonifractor plautii]
MGTISQYDDYEGGEWLTGTGSKGYGSYRPGSEQTHCDECPDRHQWPDQHPHHHRRDLPVLRHLARRQQRGTYYQVKLSDYSVKTFTPDSYGFYWAGAVSDGTNVYFGSDNGLLYWRSIADFDTTGGVLDLTDVASDAGNVRSTVMMDEDGFLYFTTQGGYLWCRSYKDGLTVEWKAKLGPDPDTNVTSTSTPTKVGDRIYVGYYSGFSDGGVQCVTVSIGEDGSELYPFCRSGGLRLPCSELHRGDGRRHRHRLPVLQHQRPEGCLATATAMTVARPAARFGAQRATPTPWAAWPLTTATLSSAMTITTCTWCTTDWSGRSSAHSMRKRNEAPGRRCARRPGVFFGKAWKALPGRFHSL